MSAVLARDVSLLLGRRGFWLVLAFWVCANSIFFFLLLDEFLKIQAALRAKNFHYGVTDMVLMPYLQISGYFSAAMIACLCSRLFYLERFADFALLHRSLRAHPLRVVVAKCGYIVLASSLALVIVAMPVWVVGIFFAYDGFRIAMTLSVLLLLLFAIGSLSMVFSQVFAHSVLVVMAVALVSLMLIMPAKWFVDPAWVAPITAFFSPAAHWHRAIIGVMNVSDVVFWLLSIVMLVAVAVRQSYNAYWRDQTA